MATSCCIQSNQGKPLLSNATSMKKDEQLSPLWLGAKESTELLNNPLENCVVLGVTETGVPQYALNIDSEDLGSIETSLNGKFIDLRVGLFMVDSPIAHTLSKGWSLLKWKKSSNFCTNCGQPLVLNLAGSQASCSSCKSVYYPTTSPVGIVSVCDPSNDSLLLIRQPRYPPGMYSCIAGFLDVGETLDDCVKREVAEEVGMEVSKVSYLGSQHWPFPAGSLMIGCQADALPGQTPDPCKMELEDARWFSREQVQEAFDRIKEQPRLRVGKNNDPSQIFIPPRGAIANFLVSKWLNKAPL